MASIPGEGMNICKRIMLLGHGGTLNSYRATSPLVRLVEREKRWKTSDQPQGVIPQNYGGTEQSPTVTCIVLKAKANDRCRNLAAMSFAGLDLMLLSVMRHK
ncbi:uncharacterized protein TNCV_1247861 [Trichonephila clavipes]|nr:uncharacterized protein TNCV_1247861 [Trichonephila clavipes]